MRKRIIDSFKMVHLCDLCGEIIPIVDDGYSDSNSRISFNLPYNKELGMKGNEIDFHPKCFNDKIRNTFLKQVRNDYGCVVGLEDQQGNIIKTFEPSIYYKIGGEISHTCFDCSKVLNFEEVLKHTMDEGFTIKEFEKMWNSENVRFYCCSCFKKLEGVKTWEMV